MPVVFKTGGEGGCMRKGGGMSTNWDGRCQKEKEKENKGLERKKGELENGELENDARFLPFVNVAFARTRA